MNTGPKKKGKGGGKDSYPSGLPPAWESTLTAIEDFPTSLLGTQMDAGWFATHSEYGQVFIKHFKKAETKNALRETAIFDRFDQELHSNLNSPLATEMHNEHVVLMQLRLGVTMLRDDWICYRLCFAGWGSVRPHCAGL